MEEKQLSEQESLSLISQMIQKAQNAVYETGIASIMWGTVIAICSLLKLAELQFGFDLPVDPYILVFPTVMVQIWLNSKEKKERKVKPYDDRFISYIWMGFGIATFLMVLTLNVMFYHWIPSAKELASLSDNSQQFHLGEFVAPLFLLLYGLPTFITGAACKFKSMLIGGIICWACCIITLFTPIKWDYLLVAFSSITAWVIPGILLEKEYRKYKKGIQTANV